MLYSRVLRKRNFNDSVRYLNNNPLNHLKGSTQGKIRSLNKENILKRFKPTAKSGYSTSPSCIEMTEMEDDFRKLHLKLTQKIDQYTPKPFDLDSSYDIIMNKISWYDESINDFSLGEDDLNETKSNSYTEDIPNLGDKITGKIITNAIESEKTMRRIFDSSLMIPNKK